MSVKSNTVVSPVVADEATVAAYRAADQSGKAKIRAAVTKSMHEAISNLDMDGAVQAKATLEALVTTKPEAPRVAPSVVVAHRIATLRLAADMLAEGTYLPEGIEADSVDVESITEALAEIGLAEVRDGAAKIAAQKITRSTERRSIQQVIDNAFADLSEGDFLTVAQIRTLGSWEGYVPSDGAIAARLFPRNGSESTLEGVEATEATGSNVRGATKI